jgi:uncharacterized protein (TIGR03435 family)
MIGVYDSASADSCHMFQGGAGHPLLANAVDMDDLAQYIENWTDLPLMNRTGLKGLFAVKTGGWQPMQLPPPPPPSPDGRPPLPPNNRGPSGEALPTIFTVLKSLGLELRRESASVTMYTVERAERP